MRPEISLVLFTTLSGVGQGLFIFVTTLYLSTYFGTYVPMELLVLLSSISLIFSGLGGMASLFHLGHPARAWKAIKKWQHSWLSREAILLPIFVGLISLFLLGLLLEFSFFQLTLIALLACGVSLSLFLASAMLYAAIYFIKEWSNLLTLFNFALFGITSGSAFGVSALFLLIPKSNLGQISIVVLIVLGGISLVMKVLTYWYNDHLYNPWNLRNALGINALDIRLMDKGASYETYNSYEFHQPTNSRQNSLMKTNVLLIGFIIPLIIWVFIQQGLLSSQLEYYSLGAAISMLYGLFLERKLFFAQGNHVQNLYYGNFRSPDVVNPLVIFGQK